MHSNFPPGANREDSPAKVLPQPSNMGSVTVTSLSHVFPILVTVIRYENVSPASVTAGSKPLAAVTSVTSFEISMPGRRGRIAVHEAFADFSCAEGAGEEADTEAASDTSPASISA